MTLKIYGKLPTIQDISVDSNLNLLDGTKDFSGDWENLEHWQNDGTYKDLTVKKITKPWFGLHKTFTAPKDGTYTFSAYVKSSGNNAYIRRYTKLNFREDGTYKDLGNNFDWIRDSFTVTLKAKDTASVRYEISGTGELWTAGHKWEQGSVATPWMPSKNEVTSDKLTAFTKLDQEGYDKYVIYDDVKAFSDKTPLIVSDNKETTPTLGTITKKFNTVAPEQLFDIVSSSGYVTGQPTKHPYFCELKAKDGYQFSETSVISISYAYNNPFTGSTVPFTEKITVPEKTQTVYIFGFNQKPKIYAPKDISATNIIEKKTESPKPVETLEDILNVYRMSNAKLKKFKESIYKDSSGDVLQFSKFIESLKPLKLNFDNLGVETGVKIGNNILTDFTLPHLKNIENVKVASFNLSNMTNKNDPSIYLVNPFVKPFQLKNVNFGKILDIYLTWNVQKDLLEFNCYQEDSLVFSNSVKYGDKVRLYQKSTSTVVNVNEDTETYENKFYLQIETNKIDTSQKVFEVNSYKSYESLPNYFVCDDIENVNIPENDFDIVKKIMREGVYLAQK